MNERFKKYFGIIIIIGIALWGIQRFVLNQYQLPRGQTTTEQVTFLEGETEVSKEIMTTGGTKHSIALDEIQSGGPPKDGIPPIDHPSFVSVRAANDYLADDEVGLSVVIDDIARFYPYQILVWHEIVNDTFNDQRVLVTYCPLCFTGIVFDPVVDGERVEFGTSGKLWNSNLLMYDRKTDSLWSQVIGEAVVGEMTGTKLATLSSDTVKYGDWKQQFPDGEVLSKDTGIARSYGQDPYGDYYTTPGVYFPVNHRDDRLPEKAFVLGIVIDGVAKAYDPEAVKRVGEVRETFQGVPLVVRYEEDLDAVRIYEQQSDGTLERINPHGGFWFSWVAVYPETELFSQ